MDAYTQPRNEAQQMSFEEANIEVAEALTKNDLREKLVSIYAHSNTEKHLT